MNQAPARTRPSRRARPEVDRLANGGPVHRALEDVFAKTDVVERMRHDPVQYARRFADVHDVELVSLVATSLAFGNVKTIRAKIEDVLARLGPSPSAFADDARAVHRALAKFRHRVWTGDDVARLLVGARGVQRAHGTLGAFLAARYREHDDLREALACLVDEIRARGGLDRSKATSARHLLPDPRMESGCKRLLLMLRWLVRGPDDVDVGLWSGLLPTSALLVPVDVHLLRIGKNLGLTRRTTASFKTTIELTEALRRFDPDDPVRFDFALCHLGMVQRCPERRDPVRCEGCGVRPVCLHWDARK